MTAGCAPPEGGAPVEGVDLSAQAVVEGTVLRDGRPARAFVRLLDADGEFTAEVPTGEAGTFRFFASPGTWTVRALGPRGASGQAVVRAETGGRAAAEVVLGGGQ